MAGLHLSRWKTLLKGWRPHLILIHKFRIVEIQAEINLAKAIVKSEKGFLVNRERSGVAMC